MCGIAGFFGFRQRDGSVAEAMSRALLKRGPDAQHACFWDASLQRTTDSIHHALLHTRLSIIDPRPDADQPMSNDDGSIWISYNGEVYDWAGHAKELTRQGARFRTRSDTEFILRGYQVWGIDGILDRLRGMFAFAILDLRRRKVWLARDRMGEKPLVYSHRDGEFAFGSLVRSVLPWLPRDARSFDPQSIDAYLTHRYVPAPRTIFADIRRLENGHLLEYDLSDGSLRQRCYWQPTARSGEWLAGLDAAVEMRTVADRPLGLFLSSGIDSSLIACRLAALGHPGLRTFSAAFPGSAMDESADAARTANVLGLPNLAVSVPTVIARDFAQIIADLDEPFADPSSFPTWYLARATTEHVKVVLGGDGGDELFAGYKRYARHLQTRWRAGLRLPLPTLPMAGKRGWLRLGAELSLDWLSAYSLRFSGLTPNQRALLQPDYRAGQAHYWRASDGTETSPLRALLAVDMANYLPEYVLRKVDLCTMAHGLEARAPLVDHEWYRCLLALPDELRFTRPPKQLLRDAMQQLAGLDPFSRKKKGFNPPLDHWIKVDLASRRDGLGQRLAALTSGQIAARGCDAIFAHFDRHGEIAEQALQLLILDESLGQLARLAAAGDA